MGAAGQIREVRVIYNEELPWELLKGRLGSHSFIHRVRQNDGSGWSSFLEQGKTALSMGWPLQGGKERVLC